jgi:TonB family protein
MAWISSCHSCDPASPHGLAIERGPRTARGNSMKAFCTMILICCSLSLGTGAAAAQADHDTSNRKLITRVEPDYPETLRRIYVGGIVRLEVTISANGSVQNSTLLGGNPILGQSAMAAVKKWKYLPASSRTVTQIRFTFDPHR